MEKFSVLYDWLIIAGVFFCIFLIFFMIWKNRKIQATECGHKTKIKDSVEAFGEKTEIEVPVKNGKTLYCHKCLEKMTIQCAWCGKSIFIGSPITLYSPRDKNEKMSDYAVLYNKENNSFVGCLRRKCADSGFDRMGFWHPPGEVYRVPSPLEMSLMDMERGGSGVIIINDLSKP